MSDLSEAPASKADLESVRSELRSDIQRLGGELVKTNSRIDRLEDALRSEMRDGFHRIHSTIDAFLGKLEMFSRETVTLPKTLDAHGVQLRDHERRIGAVERRV